MTWDADAKEKQVFLDGVFAGREKLDDIPTPDVIYVGCIMRNPVKNRKFIAGALIDELRITDDVLWRGHKRGERVFPLPKRPYEK